MGETSDKANRSVEYWEKKYSDIKTVDRDGIIFEDGYEIVFKHCAGNRYHSDTCVAERDLSAVPPYFEFFTSDNPTRIVFDETGVFSKSKNNKHFMELQMQISDMGYSTYDLS